jgi:HTH-type transcriptional regulator / antitoxin HigA
MAERKTTIRPARVSAAYLELVRQCPLRPIRSEAELDRALVMINRLLDRDRLARAEEDYLDVLSDLVERYEDIAHPISTEDLSDAEMLAHLMEAKEVRQVDVARATGIAESTLSEVLSGKRKLNRTQIAKLAGYFHVEPGVFFREEGGQ